MIAGHDRPLRIAVVGAGIAGLSTAIGLANEGHDVVLYERSGFKNEAGAAIAISPNATRILDKWGFDFKSAGAVNNCQMRRMNAESLVVESHESFENTAGTYGNIWAFFHRADLHTELRRLVLSHTQLKIRLELESEVVSVDCEAGSLQFHDGRTIQKDLLILADGAHCRHIAAVTGTDAPNVATPMSMYRFLLPFADLMEDTRTRPFFQDEDAGFLTFYKSEPGRPGLLLNTYPCRNGELLYCALLHPTKPSEKNLEAWDHPATADDVLGYAAAFHPSVQAICEKAVDVRVYTQKFRNSLPRFVQGKAVLIGDAAHFMLPTHGQGASCAIEDAAALEVVLSGATESNLQERLQLFQRIRHPRATATQALSNFMMAPNVKMMAEARKYYDGPLPDPASKTHSRAFCDFFFNYDVRKEAARAMDEASGR